jgi:hypothetical protein
LKIRQSTIGDDRLPDDGTCQQEQVERLEEVGRGRHDEAHVGGVALDVDAGHAAARPAAPVDG